MEIFPHWKGSNTILNLSVHSVTSLSRWTDYSSNTTTMERIRPFGLVKKKSLSQTLIPGKIPHAAGYSQKTKPNKPLTELRRCQSAVSVC